jgi:hypothetical protein
MDSTDFFKRFADHQEVGRDVNDSHLSVFYDNGSEVGLWHEDRATTIGTGSVLSQGDADIARQWFARDVQRDAANVATASKSAADELRRQRAAERPSSTLLGMVAPEDVGRFRAALAAKYPRIARLLDLEIAREHTKPADYISVVKYRQEGVELGIDNGAQTMLITFLNAPDTNAVARLEEKGFTYQPAYWGWTIKKTPLNRKVAEDVVRSIAGRSAEPQR